MFYCEEHLYGVGQCIYRQKEPVEYFCVVEDGLIELVSEYNLDGSRRAVFTAVSQLSSH